MSWPLSLISRRLVHGAAARLATPPKLGTFGHYRFGRGESEGPMRAVRRYLWPRLDRPVVVPFHEGLRFRLCPDDETSSILFRTGWFEPNETYWFHQAVEPGMTVLDIGANCGVYTLLAASRVGPTGRVIAFEPSPRERAKLEANLAINGLTNVHVVPAGAWDRAGEGQLLIAAPPFTGHNTLGGFIYPRTTAQREDSVQLVRIDDVVRELGLDRVDLIKLDVEGAEARAMAGAVKTLERFRPVALVEVDGRTLAHQGATREQLLEGFTSRGYDLWAFDMASGALTPREAHQIDDGPNVVALPQAASAAVCGRAA